MLRSFGSSLSSNVDVDDNGYNGMLELLVITHKYYELAIHFIFSVLCKTKDHAWFLVFNYFKLKVVSWYLPV